MSLSEFDLSGPRGGMLLLIDRFLKEEPDLGLKLSQMTMLFSG